MRNSLGNLASRVNKKMILVAAAFLAVLAVDHVLPDQQAKLVASVIPALGLDLDVLADPVAAGFPDGFDVESQGLVRWGRMDAVRPKASIQ